MTVPIRRLATAAVFLAVAVPSAQQPVAPRDARTAEAIAGTAGIVGSVVVAGTGQPARNARVNLSSAELRGSRSAATDARGEFAFTHLPAGSYTLSVSKPGYVNISYGQARPGPGRPGTPIQLADGQQFEARLQIPRGGVITGTVLDEHGEAVPGTQVRVLRYAMQNGIRTLQQGGGASTDDRGIYRVYGLQPGEYLVLANPRNVGVRGQIEELRTRIQAMRQEAAALAQRDPERARQLMGRAEFVQPDLPEDDEAVTGYAPVYYPGTTLPASAATITVGAGEERGGVDFQLQLVAIARVEGIVVSGTDQPASNLQVTLMPAQNVPGLGSQSARPAADGKFAIANVAPGQYRLAARGVLPGSAPTIVAEGPLRQGRGRARAMLNPGRLWAMTDLTVDGRNVSNIVLTLQPGMTVAGRVTFEGAAQPPADLTGIRVSLIPVDGGNAPREFAGTALGRVEANGRFTIGSVVPGRYQLNASGAGRGWFLQSAVIDGQDSLDFPTEVKPNQNVSGAVVTFSDQQAELSGTLTDSRGQPAPDYTVIAFPADQRYWVPQSRRIQSTRPATDGRFTFRNLPPGEYRLTPVVDPEPGSWFDPAVLQQLDSASVRVLLAEGEKKVQNIRLAGL